MVKRFQALFLLIVILGVFIAPCSWGGGKDITILYSNNINGQINPSG